MEKTEFLVVGAGVSGLSFAGQLASDRYLILEAEDEPGGYCRTVKKSGFVWDYSGHFFHFKNPEIEQELVAKMGDERVLVVEKQSRILWNGADIENKYVDFPFQKNIHQLPKADFVECIHDLVLREDTSPTNFEEMLYAKFGRAIAEKFLIPYNEKLYATKLTRLDVDAMGRFFPHANAEEIVRNFRSPDAHSYNQTFTYPEGGAIQYIRALLSDVDERRLRLGERLVEVDTKARVATTTKGTIQYEKLISSVPFPRLLHMTGRPVDSKTTSWNKVLVFNLGFDRKGPTGMHWLYIPQRELCFYRVGFYDNIFATGRMSLYVEIGLGQDERVDVAAWQQAVMRDLQRSGVVSDHNLVASHSVVLDPAYVHITRSGQQQVASQKLVWEADGVYSIGRYGSWTYCSIEDNIVEARALAATWV